MSKHALIIVMTVLLFAIAAIAQGQEGDRTGPRIDLGLGAHVGTPLGLSASMGAIFDRKTSRGLSRGVYTLAEPGLGGGKVRAGVYQLGPYGAGYAGGLALLRTWRDPHGVTPNCTYVGAEGQWFAFGLSPRIGMFYRTAGEDRQSPWFVAASLGLLF